MEISNSTYGVSRDWSYKGECFYSISSSWRLGSRPILKIRIANWSPKYDRNNHSILYYDVQTEIEALDILKKYKDFDFKSVENEFETIWIKDNFEDKGFFNTGETNIWWDTKFLPYIRSKIIKL